MLFKTDPDTTQQRWCLKKDLLTQESALNKIPYSLQSTYTRPAKWQRKISDHHNPRRTCLWFACLVAEASRQVLSPHTIIMPPNPETVVAAFFANISHNLLFNITTTSTSMLPPRMTTLSAGTFPSPLYRVYRLK